MKYDPQKTGVSPDIVPKNAEITDICLVVLFTIMQRDPARYKPLMRLRLSTKR